MNGAGQEPIKFDGLLRRFNFLNSCWIFFYRVVRSRDQVERYDLNCRILRHHFVTSAVQNVRHGNLSGIVWTLIRYNMWFSTLEISPAQLCSATDWIAPQSLIVYLWTEAIRNIREFKQPLSNDVFERRTSTGSGSFALFGCVFFTNSWANRLFKSKDT